MSNFTLFEYFALSAIFEEQPELVYGLMRQLWAAEIADRESAGAGFYTAIDVPDELSLDGLPTILGHSVRARVDGMVHPLGFNLFSRQGKLSLLEIFSLNDEDTAGLSSESVVFRIIKHDQVQRGWEPLGVGSAKVINGISDIGPHPLKGAVFANRVRTSACH